MTDTKTPSPSDAEIVALLGDPKYSTIGAVREAVARWGQPMAVAGGELVACGNCGGSGRMVRDPDIGTDQECFACEGSGSYSDAAPPPQAVREPQPMPDLTQLTERGAEAWAGMDAKALRGECTLQDFERSLIARADERKPFTPAQQERLYRNRPANVGKSASLAEWRRTVEFVESAHGIAKGGQHG
ncbi:hypothetical protein [Acidovorax sp. NB1]|uniref:hypothetical protein n=1 Tax=Acidovorax sp. NB1 TaxID=1943571 RepID=UPI0010EADC84|nr:hypothetical protein [Acidovorax sp. NB1]GDY37279.1 hypothetical protein ACINB_31710 [Acidovorax sp. NB1]